MGVGVNSRRRDSLSLPQIELLRIIGISNYRIIHISCYERITQSLQGS